MYKLCNPSLASGLRAYFWSSDRQDAPDPVPQTLWFRWGQPDEELRDVGSGKTLLNVTWFGVFVQGYVQQDTRESCNNLVEAALKTGKPRCGGGAFPGFAELSDLWHVIPTPETLARRLPPEALNSLAQALAVSLGVRSPRGQLPKDVVYSGFCGLGRAVQRLGFDS